jgi:aminomuconate-semialdehyde/2-hydroxymuconate-6-semialdehyde dehydrogenase
LVLGKPDDQNANFGPLVSKEHQQKVLSYYKKAVEEGATVELGGGVPDMPADLQSGAWVEPTIWTGLTDNCSVVQEEIFGPCCALLPFDEEDDVIRRANDTDYGLACAIWTENTSRAIRVSRQIDAGIIWGNSWFLRDLRTLFGGMKKSGIVREGGVHGLEFMQN